MEELTFMIVKKTGPQMNKMATVSILETSEHESIWSALGGKENDVFVYDRCGRLSHFIPSPSSVMYPKRLVEEAVRATYRHNVCGDCVVYNKGVWNFLKTWWKQLLNSLTISSSAVTEKNSV